MSSIFSLAEKGNTSQKNKQSSPTPWVVMFRTLEANQVLRPILGVCPISADMWNAEPQLASFRTYSSSHHPPGTAGARSSASKAETTALTTVLEHWDITEMCGDWETELWLCFRLLHSYDLPTEDGTVQSGSVQLELHSWGQKAQMKYLTSSFPFT